MPEFPSATPEFRQLLSAFLDATSAVKGFSLVLYLNLLALGDAGEYPGNRFMSERMQVSQHTVESCEAALREAGLLELAEGNHRRRQYRLLNAFPPVDPAKVIAPASAPEASQPQAAGPTIVPQGESAPAVAADPKPAVKEPKVKAPALTPEAQAWVLSSPQNVDLYLRFGAAAVGKTLAQCAALAPTGSDWLKYQPANPEMPYDKRWQIGQFMGFYWHGVTLWRAKHRISLELPRWPRLSGDVGPMLKSVDPWVVFQRIHTVVNNFDMIKFWVGKFGQNWCLDSATLSNRQLMERVNEIIWHFNNDPDQGNAWRGAHYQRMAEVGASSG